MRKNEKHAKAIMWYQANIPGVLDQTGRCAGCETPIGINAEIEPPKYKHRIHMAEHISGKKNTAADLKTAEAIHRLGTRPRGEINAAADLEQKQRNQQWLQHFLPIDAAHGLHHRAVDLRPGHERQMIRQMESKKNHQNAERR